MALVVDSGLDRAIRAELPSSQSLCGRHVICLQSRLAIRVCDFRNYSSDGERVTVLSDLPRHQSKAKKASVAEALSFVPLRNGVRAGEAGIAGVARRR